MIEWPARCLLHTPGGAREPHGSSAVAARQRWPAMSVRQTASVCPQHLRLVGAVVLAADDLALAAAASDRTFRRCHATARRMSLRPSVGASLARIWRSLR